MTTIELGPLPEPRVSFGPAAAMIRLAPGDYYTADQMRAYAMQERAEESELAAQHIAALEREIARQKEVIANVNARCDHLGMSLRDIKAERDAERERCANLCRKLRSMDGDFLYRAIMGEAVTWPNRNG